MLIGVIVHDCIHEREGKLERLVHKKIKKLHDTVKESIGRANKASEKSQSQYCIVRLHVHIHCIHILYNSTYIWFKCITKRVFCNPGSITVLL